jgi:hypothetical protein
MTTFEMEFDLERNCEVIQSSLRAAPRHSIQAMSQNLRRNLKTHVPIVEIRTVTVSDGFNCLRAGSKFRRKLEPVHIRTFTRGAISRGLQIVRPDTMHLCRQRLRREPAIACGVVREWGEYATARPAVQAAARSRRAGRAP